MNLSRRIPLVLLMMLLLTLIIGSGIGQASTFQDVTTQNPNSRFINYLTDRGLIGGFPDGTFRPDEGLTRAQAAAMLFRVAELPPAETSTGFSDVPAEHWAAESINAATAAGFLGGYPDGTFRPNAMLTRAEGISLFLRLSEQPDPGVTLPDLADVGTDHWAARAIAVGIASKMIGVSASGKNFYPNAPFTRGDLARALGILLTKDPSLYQTPLTGQLIVNKGEVTVTQAGNTSVLAKGDTLQINPGDAIQTGSSAVAELTFPDGSGLRIEENTDLTVKKSRGRSYIKPDGSPGISVDWFNIDVEKGKIFGALASKFDKQEESTESVANTANLAQYPLVASVNGHGLKDVLINKLQYNIVAAENDNAATVTEQENESLPWWEVTENKRVRVEVDMPWSVAAIRGTFWSNVVYRNGRSSTAVFVGEGEVTSGAETVDVSAGQRTETTEAGTPPAPPSPVTTQDRQDWVNVAQWAVDRAAEIDTNLERETPEPPAAQEQPEQQPVQQQPISQQPAGQQPVQQQNTFHTLGVVYNSLTDANDGESPDVSLPPDVNEPSISPTIEPEPDPASSGGGGNGGTDDNATQDFISIIDTPGEVYNGDFSITESIIEENENGTTFGPETGTSTIDGTLTLNPGSNGDVTLQNIVATNIKILSGDSDSITLENISIPQGTLTVNAANQDNKVHVITKGSTLVASTNIYSQAILDSQSGNGSFGNINIDPVEGNQTTIDLQGIFNSTITVAQDADGVTLNIKEGSEIENLNMEGDTNLTGFLTAVSNATAGDGVSINEGSTSLAYLNKPRIAFTGIDGGVPTVIVSKDVTSANFVMNSGPWHPELILADGNTCNIGIVDSQGNWGTSVEAFSGVGRKIALFAMGFQTETEEYKAILYTGTFGSNDFVKVDESETFTFPVDNTEVLFSEGYPKNDNLTENSVDLLVQINKPGYVHHLIIPKQQAQNFSFTASDIKEWNPEDHPNVSSSSGYFTLFNDEGSHTFNLTGGTDYITYFVAEDVYGNLSDIQTIEFTLPVDGTSPSFIEGYPAVNNISVGSAELKVITSEFTSVHYLALLAGDAVDLENNTWEGTPNAGIIQQWAEDPENYNTYEVPSWSGHNHSVDPNELYSFPLDKLIGNTDYIVYAVAEDTSDHVSAVERKLFTTNTLGTFTSLSESMNTARKRHTATKLDDGGILIAGGLNENFDPLAGAELYDPSSNSFSTVTDMVYGTDMDYAREGHTATKLYDGSVLITGGAGITGLPSYAELFDPDSGEFMSVAEMVYARERHTATLLNDDGGMVLITGGEDENGNQLATAELYDPTEETFTTTVGEMVYAREGHTATLLNSGKVLLTGGYDENGDPLASAELYNPGNGTFTPSGNMNTSRGDHAATLLNDGKVLITGGWGDGSSYPLNSAELYIPGVGFEPVEEDMFFSRVHHKAILLDGKVLILPDGNKTGAAELFDPATNSFTSVAIMNEKPLREFAVTLLNDGTVLITGGEDENDNILSRAELYQQ